MSRVNKIAVLVVSALVLLICGIGLSFTSQRGTYAYDYNIGTSVDYNDNIKQLNIKAYKFNTFDTETSVQDIENNGFVLLENADTVDHSKPKQGVKFVIEPGSNSVKIPALEVDVFLNGEQLSLDDAYIDDGDNVDNISNKTLSFVISPYTTLHYYNKLDSFGNRKEVEDKQGQYEFYFKLRVNQNNETSNYYPQNVNWYRYSFIVLDQVNYGIDDENDLQFPRILNVDASIESANPNYIRQKTFHYNQKDENDKAIYPALRFDPEKYRIDIKRVLNNENYTIQTSFVYTDATFNTNNALNRVSNYGVLFFNYSNGEQVGFKLTRENGKFFFKEDFDANSTNAINYKLPIFYELGSYDVTYKYQVFIDGAFVCESDTASNIKIGTENLIVYGYNLSYANNLTDENYFISLKEGLNTDYSYMYVGKQDASTETVTNFTIPALSAFVSTNQAPVWLNSNVYLRTENTTKSFYYYSQTGVEFADDNGMLSLNDLSTNMQRSISKNMYFTDAGYYIVVVDYGYESFVGNTFKQVFMFRITNSTPKVNIVVDDTEQSVLPSGGFTKYSAFIAIEKPKAFDSLVTASFSVDRNFNSNYTLYSNFTPRYFKYGTNGEMVFDNDSEYTTFTAQGKYFVRVYFNNTSYSTYSFTIDKISLNNQVSTYSVNPYSGSNLFIYKDNLNNANVTNLPFTVVVRNKLSGSPITVNLMTYDVVWQVNAMQTEPYINSDNKTYIYTDYVATNASSKQRYNNIISANDVSNLVDSSFVFDEQKIYIFEITDASGYRIIHSVFLDNTSSKFLQYDSEDRLIEVDDFNVISEKTTIKWANNKALLFKDPVTANDRTAVSLLLESSSMYQYLPSGLSLIIPYQSIKIDALDLTGENLKLNFSDMNNSATDLTIYPDLATYSSITDTRVKGEKQYLITLKDVSNNTHSYLIEMNMDKSLGKMFTTNTPYISGETTYRVNKLNLEQAGSYDALVFEWKDVGEGAFKIASLTYDYYPLVFDTSKTNYPYTDEPMDRNVDLLAGAISSNDIYYSGIINPMATTYTTYDSLGRIIQNSKLITKLGKYVITRTYVGGSEIESAGDTATKVYTYYADNNPVIDVPDFNNPNNYYIGNGVSILFGDQEVSFDKFYQEGLDSASVTYYEGTKRVQRNLSILLKSNLLPIKIRVPESKYSQVNGMIVNSYNAPKTFNLTVIVTKYNSNGILESVKEYSDVLGGFIKVDDIVEEGIYKFEIRDRALTPNTQLSPINDNYNYVAFKIVFERPSAEIETAKECYEQSAREPLTLSTRSDIGAYVYTVDRNVIDASSIVVYRRTKIANGLFGEYEVFNTDFASTGSNIIELIAYETNNNVLQTYQYKVVGKFIGTEEEFTQFTPIIADFDKFSTLDYGITSTKNNVVMMTFDDPFDEYYAKIDTTDIVVKKYVKLANGNYSSPTTLVNGVDYIVEERVLSDKRIKYSLIIYQVDNDNPLAEYKFEIGYHYAGQEAYYIIKGANGENVNYYSNSTTLIIDKTPPSYNLNRLSGLAVNQTVLNDNSLSKAYKTTYYKAEDGVYYYANIGLIDFAIDTNFEFTLPSESATLYAKSHEGAQIYFRKLNKYNRDRKMDLYTEEQLSRSYQSLVPGDPDYYVGNSAKLRFNPAIFDNSVSYFENWVSFEYGIGKSFYAMLTEYFQTYTATVDGYYEIVEVDQAGNYTVYTVLLNTKNPTINADINTVEGPTNVKYDFTTTEINSLNTFSITDFNMLDAWYTVTLNGTKIVANPDTDTDALIARINSLFMSNHVNELSISNRFGNQYKVNVSITTSDKRLGILAVSNTANENGNYRVVFEEDQDGIRLKKITAYIFDERNGVFVLLDGDENGISEDSENLDLIVDVNNPNATRLYYFAPGIYKFVLEDNFRSGDAAYSINVNIGIYGNWDFSYQFEPIIKNGMKYTYGNVVLTASSVLFEVTATKNGVPIVLNINSNSDTHIFRPEPTSNDIDLLSGGEAVYKINIHNITTGETESYEFAIYNIFPAVNAVDMQDENMNGILSLSKNQVSTFTTKSLKLSWDTKNYKFGYNITLLRYEDGGDVATSRTTLSGSSVNVSNEGLYELRFTTNELGNTRSVFFMIKNSKISMYEVYERLANGSLNVLLPAEEMLDITNYERAIKTYLNGEHGFTYPYINGRILVKNYFSIYNFAIEVEGDKNLKTNFGDLENAIVYEYTDNYASLNGRFTTNIIVVYGSSPYSYFDVFAITKIQANSKFLTNFGFIYDVETETVNEAGEKEISTESKDVKTDATLYDNIAIYDAPLTVYWQSYYGVVQNQVYMKYYFQNKYIDTIYGTLIDEQTSSYTFTTAGEYRLEFYDLAGNKQLFSNANSASFTLVLKNQVVYTVNGALPIYGAVYNSNVVLKIQDVSSYVSTGTGVRPISVEIYRNGTKYDLNGINYTYTFTSQGLYRVLINASVREGNATKRLKESELVFSIINENEARFAYEFSNINGYEISKVVKNNIDITDNIKGDNVAIYSLLLSADSYGVGRYHIYVKGNQINSLNALQQFDYYIWINNEVPVIECSCKYNETSTKKITLKYNSLAIYEQIGNCKIVIANDEFLINKDNVEDKITTLSITRAGTYFVTLKTEAGNVVSMFKITKKDPLNTISIILIVLGVAAVIAIGVVFYRLRINMKIK